VEASRQVRLTDEVLTRLEADLSSSETDVHPLVSSRENDRHTSRRGTSGGVAPS
jgi:hypothetical protein